MVNAKTSKFAFAYHGDNFQSMKFLEVPVSGEEGEVDFKRCGA